MAKFGVLGSGEVGQELAKGLRGIGHEVRIGSRDPRKLAAYTAETKIPNGTFAEVAKWGDALVLAVLGSAAEDVLRQVGVENFAGKLVIDTTDPITEAPPRDGVLECFTGPNESLMERLQKAAPRARFVKAFNSVGSAMMVNPKFAGGKPTMFYCGNDPAARAETARILEQFGWEAADMGTAVAARAIEPLAVLWCIPGFREDRWTHAFKLLTR
ncbi:MAG TPA: NAD(P)-binding domain-containing protein [Gemmatimonadales bacterium]|nr:NAD(P)-binding domain-containing protein [Gemmatimonadales bacterium]